MNKNKGIKIQTCDNILRRKKIGKNGKLDEMKEYKTKN